MTILRRVLSSLSLVLLVAIGVMFANIVAALDGSVLALGVMATFVVFALAHVVGSILGWRTSTMQSRPWAVLGLLASGFAALGWAMMLVAAVSQSSVNAAPVPGTGAIVLFSLLALSASANALHFAGGKGTAADQAAQQCRCSRSPHARLRLNGAVSPKMLLRHLIPKLEANFPGQFSISGDVVTFPQKHPAVGCVEVHDDAEELTVYAGNFTHLHFSSFDSSRSAEQAAERIAEDALAFLIKLFADQIVMWGSLRGRGGCYERAAGKSSIFSFMRGQEYVWSGPIA